jgi:hypothetical protein
VPAGNYASITPIRAPGEATDVRLGLESITIGTPAI